ncbi:hypothetical protein EVAR_45865_1 [Eumeta japonica]|uniref:Uncharacterized protein n=1 Tax=Eumeta variegata TaxID=151549 RepID=A0A4C1WPG4_EUMVA|nr:hypothetical protein EVAR_45865_1 [Eumeta japonica]
MSTSPFPKTFPKNVYHITKHYPHSRGAAGARKRGIAAEFICRSTTTAVGRRALKTEADPIRFRRRLQINYRAARNGAAQQKVAIPRARGRGGAGAKKIGLRAKEAEKKLL